MTNLFRGYAPNVDDSELTLRLKILELNFESRNALQIYYDFLYPIYPELETEGKTKLKKLTFLTII